MENAAILTGDLIGSTKAEPEVADAAMNALAIAAKQISQWAGTDTRFTRFRGDGWQVYLADTSLVLRATLLLLATLRSAGTGLSTRLSIAVGTVDRISEIDLSDAAGQAFTLSGRNLDKMLSYENFVYAEPERKDFWKSATMNLAVWQASQWTREQAEAVAFALELARPKDEVLAKRLGISRQALQSRLKGSGIMAASYALFAFEIDRKTMEN
jgi:hypothetical protein